ncbi:MAG: peptidoglycan editing factor PgeF [Deltaproteobacteria bacterium]|nr:peptidoglycan editing factor PgeF [Deltaproteobacteria bacterium]
MFRIARREEIEFYEAEELAALDFVTHAFCTRLGGVSEGPFASLNTGFLVGDREGDVRRNLERIGRAFAIPPGQMVLMGQVHGDRICVIDGEGTPPELIPQCDGMITARSNVALGIRTADCMPLLFVDPVRRIAGVAHAGWRGTALGIAAKMVKTFEQHFSSRRADLWVAVGPAIGSCCYQVDAPVRDAFADRHDAEAFLQACSEAGRWMLDLGMANRLQLLEAGIPPGNILVCGQCTACRQELFFSHRGERGCTGRLLNFLMLRDGSRPKNA